MVSIKELLEEMIRKGASDLHITVGSPPRIRVDGELKKLDYEEITPQKSRKLSYSVMTEKQRKQFEEEWELDFSFGIEGLSRFRANAFLQQGTVALALRAIPDEIRGFEELGLPPVVKKFAEYPRGLVLVTGPTGSGKSTSLAALIDKINRNRHEHIITIEDPIEYVHSHKNCLVNQREVSADTQSFGIALKHALREDPDVVLIGEMRDLETTLAALNIAETGHLVFATLHTNSAPESINRIIDIFPEEQQDQVRTQLSFVVKAVLTQQLIPRIGGGRALATEILVGTSAVSAQIRQDKIHQLYSTMQTGHKHGMMTMNKSLAKLYLDKVISLKMARTRSKDEKELNDVISRMKKKKGISSK